MVRCHFILYYYEIIIVYEVLLIMLGFCDYTDLYGAKFELKNDF